MFYLALVAALLLALAASFSFGRSTGSPKIIYRDIFTDRPLQVHPDRELVDENRALKEEVARLQAVIDAEPEEQVYLDLVLEVEKLRHLVRKKDRLRATYLRLLRVERAKVNRMAQTWSPPGYVNPFAGRVVLKVA